MKIDTSKRLINQKDIIINMNSPNDKFKIHKAKTDKTNRKNTNVQS